MCEKNQFKVYDNGEPIYLDGLKCQFSVDDANSNAIAYVYEKEIADRIAQALNSSLLLEKTLADVQAGIPARDAEIEALRKENAELREQLEAVGAGGVSGKLMPGAVCLDQVRVLAWRARDGHGLPQTDWIDGDPGEETSAWVGGDIECAYSAPVAAPVATQAQIEDDSIALDRLADYISDTWPMDKKYGIEEICQRLHAMWPGEFMPASQVDRSTETQGKPVDESPNLQGQQQPVSGADGLIDGVAQFTKKPVTISAIQWTGGNLKEVIAFTGMHPRFNEWFSCWDEYAEHVGMSGGIFKIFTPEGVMEATPGDWIIRGVKGEHYPCKPNIFAATYSVGQAQQATDFQVWIRRAYREPETAVFTIDNMEVAYQAGRAALAQQDADPLQGAADWLVKDCGVSDVVELAGRLSIGYNRATRLMDAARKEQA